MNYDLFFSYFSWQYGENGCQDHRITGHFHCGPLSSVTTRNIKRMCATTTLNVLFNDTGNIPWACWEMDRQCSLSCRNRKHHRSSSLYRSQSDLALAHTSVARTCYVLSNTVSWWINSKLRVWIWHGSRGAWEVDFCWNGMLRCVQHHLKAQNKFHEHSVGVDSSLPTLIRSNRWCCCWSQSNMVVMSQKLINHSQTQHNQVRLDPDGLVMYIICLCLLFYGH